MAYQSAPRTFEDARRLVNQVKKARGYFPIVGIGTYDDGFNSLPGNRTQAACGLARPAVAPGKVGRPEEPVVEERTVHHSSRRRSFGKVGLLDRPPEEVPTTAQEREPPHQTPECVSCAGRADTSHETVRTKEPAAPADSKNGRLEGEIWSPPLERVKLLLKCLTPMPPDT